MLSPRKSPKRAAAAALFAVSATFVIAAPSITWDFNTGGDLEGWTVIGGEVTVGHASGGSDPGMVAGPGYAHDAQHPVVLVRSPVINFSASMATGNVVEIDFQGGDGNAGAGDPTNPTAVTTYNGGTTDGNGQKGLAFLNINTGAYDAVYYKSGSNGDIQRIDGPDGASTNGLTRTDLVDAGLDLAANYQLDFFETDGGGWGWTRLNRVAVDATLGPGGGFSVIWDFNDGPGGDHGWKVENGFASFAADGVHASTNGTDFAEDAAHTTLIFRSPMINFSTANTDSAVFEVDFVGGAGNQDGAPDPANPAAALAVNGGASTPAGQKGLAFLNLATGNYDLVVYDSENGGDNPETITFTRAELITAGITITQDYRLDFFENDDGTSGWTRIESISLDAVVTPDTPPPPPPPTFSGLWDFDDQEGGDHGWTVINGFASFNADGVHASEDGTSFAHDAPHPTLLFRSPVISFREASDTAPVIEVGWQGGAGNPDGSPDAANPEAVLAFNGGNSSGNGQKGLAFLNIDTGQYDLVLYHDSNSGSGSDSLTLADLAAGGVDTSANYQLDFFDNDDGGWGWTRLDSVSVDAILDPGPTSTFEITAFSYNPVTNEVTVTWRSRPNKSYTVFYSNDLGLWGGDFNDGIPGAPDSDTTTETFDLTEFGLETLRELFIRVQENQD